MDDVKEILSQAGVFQRIDREAVQALPDELETACFLHETTIFNEGEPGDRLYIITDGKVELARRSADDRENLSTIISPSDMLGEPSIFDPDPRTSSAVCVAGVFTAPMSADQL